MKRLFFIFPLICSISVCNNPQTILPGGCIRNTQAEAVVTNAVKKKWFDWANARVENEKNKFLEVYGLNVHHLNDQETITVLKLTHDQMVEKAVDHYTLRTDSIDNKDIEVVQKIANKVFVGPVPRYVQVFNDSRFTYDQVGVSHHYATNRCYVMLNSALHIKYVARLEEILRHEYSHVINQDDFNKELIRCAAWVNSQDTHEKVERNSHPVCQAFETRADVYAAIHSPDHGKHLIDVFKTFAPHEGDLTHPIPCERIALLEQIKTEFDAAAK